MLTILSNAAAESRAAPATLPTTQSSGIGQPSDIADTTEGRPEISAVFVKHREAWYLEIVTFNSSNKVIEIPTTPRSWTISNEDIQTDFTMTYSSGGADTIHIGPDTGIVRRFQLPNVNMPAGSYNVEIRQGGKFTKMNLLTIKIVTTVAIDNKHNKEHGKH